MQSQAVQQQTVNSTQSIAYVKTLLQAGLGCITYLRNLLPPDNYSDCYLTAESSSESQSGTIKNKKSTSSVHIMALNRGYTEEADRLLDYLEGGVFDALEKQYLRSLIFAIYLDSNDPNNIVEAYTFNFQYHKIPGTDTVLPIMSLGEDLLKMSLGDSRKKEDPSAKASKQGKMPTLGDVKKSLKQMMKTLIQATTHMETLPKRRYATFKLYYTEDTPEDYEPQHFRPGDSEKDKFFFTTHDAQEPPEKFSVGTLETGLHGVQVNIQSIAAFLPSTDDNDAAFVGTANGADAPSLTPVEEASLRQKQAEAQAEDAIKRNVAWDAEAGLDVDADGEDDPDYADGVFVGNVDDSGVEFPVPIGIRMEDGEIKPLPLEFIKTRSSPRQSNSANSAMEVDEGAERHYAGYPEKVPSHAGALIGNNLMTEELSQTQQIGDTQSLGTSETPDESTTPIHLHHSRQSLPSSSLIPSSESFTCDTEIETQLISDLVMRSSSTLADADGADDSEMLDMETQLTPQAPVPEERDPIESFPSVSREGEELHDVGLDCNCGIAAQDDSLFCESGCGRWYHIWCMGYHSLDDRRLPSKFICFDCRIRGDRNYAMIAVNDLLPNMISKYNGLVLFRRAIKIVETTNPDSLAKFTKEMECEVIVAGQLFKRLEAEGFIVLESLEQDEHGILTTRARTNKSKTSGKNRPKTRKEIQKAKYSFLQSSVRTSLYADYFNPDIEVERRMMGLSAKDIRPRMRQDARSPTLPSRTIVASTSQAPPPRHYDTNSQTQDETQFVLPSAHTSKRKSSNRSEVQPSKKVKISVGPAVDLQD